MNEYNGISRIYLSSCMRSSLEVESASIPLFQDLNLVRLCFHYTFICRLSLACGIWLGAPQAKQRKQRHWAESGVKSVSFFFCVDFSVFTVPRSCVGWSTVVICWFTDSPPHSDFLWWDASTSWSHPSDLIGWSKDLGSSCLYEWTTRGIFSKNVFVFVKYSFLSIIFTCEWRVCIYDLAIMSIHLFSKWYTFFSRFRLLGST